MVVWWCSVCLVYFRGNIACTGRIRPAGGGVSCSACREWTAVRPAFQTRPDRIAHGWVCELRQFCAAEISKKLEKKNRTSQSWTTSVCVRERERVFSHHTQTSVLKRSTNCNTPCENCNSVFCVCFVTWNMRTFLAMQPVVDIPKPTVMLRWMKRVPSVGQL